MYLDLVASVGGLSGCDKSSDKKKNVSLMQRQQRRLNVKPGALTLQGC